MDLKDLKGGMTNSQVVVSDLSRTQMVMYAGSSGDFNPLHSDEVYATRVAGQTGVIAHGQLTLGLSAKAMTAWLPRAQIEGFGGRFLRQVLPGDTLTTRLTVTEIMMIERDKYEASLEYVTTNQDGVDVLSGYAKVSQLDQPARGPREL
jgi:acyl dehydratase